MITRAAFLTLVLCAAVAAQAQPLDELSDLDVRRVQYGGQSEILTESYTASGRQARRPDGTARLLVQPWMRFGEAFEIRADLMLSTEQRALGGDARQRINRFGISPTWSWGSAHLGDFNSAYTPLTYEGIPVRGAALNLEPGLLRFSVLGGITQRAVAGDASNGSFGRQLYAARLGVGRSESSWFDLVALYADDDAGSLSPDDLYTEPDTTQVGTYVDSSSVTPQQNLVLAAATQVSLFGRRVTWHGELAGAAYTRDKRASEIDGEDLRDVPSWLTSVFTPRHGSNLDLAYASDLRVRLQKWDLLGKYEYVGPGYRSLGVGSLLVDRRALSGRASFQARAFSVSLTGSTQHDNVLEQKRDTTRRDAIGTFVTVRPRRNLLTTWQAHFNTMDRGAGNPAQRIDYLSQLWGAGARVSLERRWIRSVGLDYRLQRADDANPARGAANFISHQVSLPVGLRLGRGLSLTPQAGLVLARNGEAAWRTTHTEKLTLRHQSEDRRWTSSLSAGTTFEEGARRLALNLGSSYRLSGAWTAKILVRNSDFRARDGSGDGWNELVARASVETAW